MSRSIIIIGGGPAGYVAAIRAAQLGGKVTLVEAEELGGVCMNRGCIPTKTYYHYAEILHDLKKCFKDKIFAGEISHDWLRIVRKKDMIVKRSVMGIGYLMKKNEIRVVKGRGKLVEPGAVEVSAGGSVEIVKGDFILIATGSKPRELPIAGWEGSGIWSSTEALSSQKIPESLLIVGGGVIGCEFAHIFSTFGSKVTIIELMETILPGVDPDIVEAVTRALAAEGVSIRTGVGIDRIERTAEGIVAHAGGEVFQAKEILSAVGRDPTPPEGAEKLGIMLERGAVVIDDTLRASENIWAAGDVCGAPFLAHWASAMGEAAIEDMFGIGARLNREAIPGAFFTALEVGTVGLTEPEARDKYGDISVGMFPYMASGRARTASATDGFAKVITIGGGRIVGIHIAGREGSEMLAAAGFAVVHGRTIDDWKKTIVAHPTFGEILREAALDTVGEALHK